MASAAQRIVQATAVAGTLDILAATILTVIHGRAPAQMLRGVASGPFPAAKDMGAGGAALGLAVHYALMAVMAAAYILAANRYPMFRTRAVQWGVIYGLITYVVMNLIVVPLRFGTLPGTTSIVTQLFCHIVLVGIPIVLIARN